MPSTEAETVVHVAVGIVHQDNKILISQRAVDKHQGGKWEFPGGQCHADESISNALIRELDEELGIQVIGSKPCLEIRHRYPEKNVHLHVYEVHAFDGSAQGREGQPIKWVDRAELSDYEFPEANRAILNRIMLPELYAITDLNHPTRDRLLPRIEQGLDNGLKLIQFRAPDLNVDEYYELAREVIDLCHKHSARVILNTEPDKVNELGADGVHLNGRRLKLLKKRPLDMPKLVAVSCHNLDEIELAQGIGADFITLSPVLDTPSHPGAKTLGWEQFGQLCQQASMPVYALGGMKLETLSIAKENLAQGIAMRSGIWGD